MKYINHSNLKVTDIYSKERFLTFTPDTNTLSTRQRPTEDHKIVVYQGYG